MTESPAAPAASRRNAWLGGLVVAVLSAAALAMLAERFPLHTDDAYITYRYAQHLAAGQGFAYNAGEQVLGTTTPLYTLLLAGAARLGADIPQTSQIINLAAVALALGVMFAWASRASGTLIGGIAAVLLAATAGDFVQFSISGMETGLYFLLIVLTFVAYDARKLVLAALLAGLCVLTRLDGAAVGVALVLHYLIANRRLPPTGVWIAYAVVVLPWVAYALLTFGDLRPQSMLAKNVHELYADRWWMLDYLLGPQALPRWPLALIGVYLAGRGGRRGVVALGLWGLLYAGAFTAYRIDLYRWYLTPLAGGIALLGGVGVGAALRATRAALADRVAALLAAGALLAPLVYANGATTRRQLAGAIHWTETLERSRLDVAEYVQERAAPDDVIATGAIGIVGWFTGNPVYDLCGLVTRESVNHPLDEQLSRSAAQWYITETSTDDPPPAIEHFRFVQAFDRNEDVRFLLYRRDENYWRGFERRETDLQLDNGITIKSVALSPNVLEVVLVASEPIDKDWKLFVHVLREPTSQTPLRMLDFSPSPPTSALEPGKPVAQRITIEPPLDDCQYVRIGLFDERDPSFARARGREGQDGVTARVAGDCDE